MSLPGVFDAEDHCFGSFRLPLYSLVHSLATAGLASADVTINPDSRVLPPSTHMSVVACAPAAASTIMIFPFRYSLSLHSFQIYSSCYVLVISFPPSPLHRLPSYMMNSVSVLLVQWEGGNSSPLFRPVSPHSPGEHYYSDRNDRLGESSEW